MIENDERVDTLTCHIYVAQMDVPDAMCRVRQSCTSLLLMVVQSVGRARDLALELREAKVMVS